MKKFRKTLIIFAPICVIVATTTLLLGCSTQQTTPTHYKISAQYNAQTHEIDALATITYTNNLEADLQNIMFHLYPRAYRENAEISPIAPADRTSAYPDGINYGDLAILSVKRDGISKDIVYGGEDEDILVVDGMLEPLQQTTIEIDFKLQLPIVRHRLGFYDGIANLGNWFPIICAYKNGEFSTTTYYSNGDPFVSDIANFYVSITTDENLTVATSGLQTTTTADGKKTTTASITNARDFAVVIGEFNVTKESFNGTEINYYYIEDEEPAKAIQTAKDSLKTFSDMMGEYVYNSLSIVKTPFLHGGMEYPALVYVSDRTSGDTFTEVVIHEIAHQWWYATVGSDQVYEAWLDEGLTEYTTTLFYEKNPDYAISAQDRLADSLATYLLYIEHFKGNGRGDTSMNRKVSDFSSSTEYSVMTYVKGQLMLDALRNAIGSDAFFNGLKDYYESNKFKTATGELFRASMENASKTDLEGFFDSWLNGKVKMYAN